MIEILETFPKFGKNRVKKVSILPYIVERTHQNSENKSIEYTSLGVLIG